MLAVLKLAKNRALWNMIVLLKGVEAMFKAMKIWIAIALLATCGFGCSSQQVSGLLGTAIGLGAAYGISQAVKR